MLTYGEMIHFAYQVVGVRADDIRQSYMVLFLILKLDQAFVRMDASVNYVLMLTALLLVVD